MVEDDEILGKATLAGLRTVFAADWIKNAEDAETAIRTTPYDLWVFDISLPGKSGLALLQALRARSNLTPCLFLTARDATYHRVEGLNAGADDYLVKPFDLDEMLARCNALLRRAQGRATPVTRHKDIIFDAVSRTVQKKGRLIPLSARELAITEILLGNIGRTISKRQIEERIYDHDSGDIVSNTVEVHISALRRKLGRDFIKTIRNIGYVVEK